MAESMLIDLITGSIGDCLAENSWTDSPYFLNTILRHAMT